MREKQVLDYDGSEGEVFWLENLFNKFGKKVKFNNRVLSIFWESRTIIKTPEQTLRNLKLGYRAKFLKRISEQFAEGQIDEFEKKLDYKVNMIIKNRFCPNY